MARMRRTSAGMIAGMMLALVGAIAGIVPLFWRGWAHLRVTFMAQDASGAQILRRLGIDVDRPIAAIAEREINRAIPPTLWQVGNHVFQVVTALLLLVALLTGMAAFTHRWRRLVSGIALLASIAAAVITAIAILKIRARFDALPDTIDAAIRASGALSQVVGYTTGRPQVNGGISWPLVASVIGVGITLVGSVLAFVASLRAPRPAAILPRFRGQATQSKENADGDAGRPAAISDDGPAPDAHPDASAIQRA
jgi:hypothetical protein